jgi:hypothetical protein
MMRYVREAHGAPAGEGAAGAPPAVDIEAGEEVSATEGEATEGETPTAEDPVDTLLRQEQKDRAKEEAAGVEMPSPPPAPSNAPPAPSKAPPAPAPGKAPPAPAKAAAPISPSGR